MLRLLRDRTRPEEADIWDVRHPWIFEARPARRVVCPLTGPRREKVVPTYLTHWQEPHADQVHGNPRSAGYALMESRYED